MGVEPLTNDCITKIDQLNEVVQLLCNSTHLDGIYHFKSTLKELAALISKATGAVEELVRGKLLEEKGKQKDNVFCFGSLELWFAEGLGDLEGIQRCGSREEFFGKLVDAATRPLLGDDEMELMGAPRGV